MGTVLSYTKVVKKAKTVQKVEGGSKISAHSSGFVSGNKATIMVNDKNILEKPNRGINVAVLAGQNHEAIFVKTYDTFGSEKASEQLAADLATVPLGSVIVAAVRDEASSKLTQSVKDFFSNMGSKEINQLQYRDGWLFLGIKGTKSHVEKRGKSVDASVILGYSRVVKRTRTKTTKTVTQTKSYKKTIKRVVKYKKTEVINGVKYTKTYTRVEKRVVTCHRSRKTSKTKTTATTTVN